MIVIKLSNASIHQLCAKCGIDFKVPSGPALFIEGTWEPICLKCGDKYMPELAKMLLDWLAEIALGEVA